MSTQAQILANQANAQKSTGPSGSSRFITSQNSTTYGLSKIGSMFFFLPDENEMEFIALESKLKLEHKPQTMTETIFVRRMAESEWLRARAQRLQLYCHDLETGSIRDQKQFALLLRYQSMHDRAFCKALSELQKLRNEKKKEEIGFVSQTRSAEVHNMKKEAFEMKKQQFEIKKSSASQPATRDVQPKEVEITQEIAA